MSIHHQPVMLCLTCYVQGYIENRIMLSKSLTKVCVCGGGGGAVFYCTTEAASLIKGVIFCWDIRANYATKSTVVKCVIRLCLGCVDELLAAFLEFPGVYGEAG